MCVHVCVRERCTVYYRETEKGRVEGGDEREISTDYLARPLVILMTSFIEGRRVGKWV